MDIFKAEFSLTSSTRKTLRNLKHLRDTRPTPGEAVEDPVQTLTASNQEKYEFKVTTANSILSASRMRLEADNFLKH